MHIDYSAMTIVTTTSSGVAYPYSEIQNALASKISEHLLMLIKISTSWNCVIYKLFKHCIKLLSRLFVIYKYYVKFQLQYKI